VTEDQDGSARSEADLDETPVADLTYEEASRELDGIVEFFEHRDVDVDQLVARLKRATTLVDELDRRVRRTRSQVEQLVPRLQASARPPEDGADSEELTADESEEPDEEDTAL
jgi:exodeoxyribonuclease VII small subunit